MTEPPVTTDDTGLESNIYEIAKIICSEPPRPPCSYQFLMDHESDPDVIFDMVRDFALACVDILFGPDKTPCDLSPDDYDKLSMYVKSIGYQIKLRTKEYDDSYEYRISFECYQTPGPNPYEHLRKYTNTCSK